jgi:hypothetical protein
LSKPSKVDSDLHHRHQFERGRGNEGDGKRQHIAHLAMLGVPGQIEQGGCHASALFASK